MTSGAAAGRAAALRRLTPLPADVTGFVGRSGELARLAVLLGGARVVTVTGPGGVGKSRLALRAAAGTGPRFPDGVCLIELARLTDPALLPDIIARRLGVPEEDPRTQLAAVLDLLRRKKLLLILDTCEHLLAASAGLALALTRLAPGVTVLATSRQPLGVQGEQVIRLGPLPLSSRGDAVELFAQRAAAAVPGWTLTPANLPDVMRLCRRLDGIPLAIELAAVRLRALPLPELADRMEGQFGVLTGQRRGMVPRHQTLRTAIEWSYQLCTPAERVLWSRLSVFAAPFDLDGARDLGACDEVPAGQVAAALAGLAAKSVALPYRSGGMADVGGNRSATDDGVPRYRLIGSLREYGLERLAAAGREGECRDRHLARYLRLGRDFGQRLTSGGQLDRLRRLRAEHADIHAALSYGFADKNRADLAASAARLAGVLYPYWHMSGALRAGVKWQEKVLARYREPSPERASGLVNLALLATAQGRPDAAERAREGTELAAGLGERHTHARGYLALHLVLALAGDYPAALEAARTARQLLTELDARTSLRCLDVQLALMYQLSGDFTAALVRCGHATAGLGPDERWLTSYANAIAALARYQQPGQADACAADARAALVAKHAIGDMVGGSYALEVLGWLAADAGRAARAAWLLGAADRLWALSGRRLAGNATMEEFHRRAAETAEESLGRPAYQRLHAAGAAEPLDRVVAVATGDGATADGDALAPRGDAAAGPAEPVVAPGPAATLTSREREIAALVASGLSNRDIAARLVISKRTVDAHVNHIFAKLKLSSRVQLTLWLREQVPRARSAPRSAELPAARHAL